MRKLRQPAFDPADVAETNFTSYPEPFREANSHRWARRLGDHVGLKNFGVNLVRIEPGAQSSARHAHSRQDEFIWVIEGEVVLDLGSGGGIDVLLSARRVGPTGKAYGLDMTDEMLDLAQRNKAAAGATNVEFLKGHIEAIPLPRETVDVIVSNCVINLSTDKDQVLREAFRVLRSANRLSVEPVPSIVRSQGLDSCRWGSSRIRLLIASSLSRR